MIKRELRKVDQVTICHKNTCLNATGRYAEAIAQALVIAFLLAGIGFLLKSIK
jgi:hypothetical protein